MIMQKAVVLDIIKTLQQFQGDPKHMLLLGAGASVTSGVPTASDLVLELLRSEYSANKHLPPRDAHIQPESKIRAWATRALPWFNPNDHKRSEYEQVMENVLRLPDARNAFLRRKLARAKPGKGYLRLGSLISRGWFNTIWTTNFDHMVRACTHHLPEPLEEVNALDQFTTLDVSLTRRRLIRLHGDFWHGDLINTPEEFRSMPQVRYEALQRLLLTQGLIVVGYGGRDRSIMDALIDVARDSTNLHKGLFWCIRKDTTCPPFVRRLVQVCGQRAYLVEIDGFDEMMAEIDKALVRKPTTKGSSASVALPDDPEFAWEGQALLADLAEALTAPCSIAQVRQRQQKSLSHLCKILGAPRAVLVCKRSPQKKFFVAAAVDLVTSNAAGWVGQHLNERSELVQMLANSNEPYLRLRIQKVRNDAFFSSISLGEPLHTISVSVRGDVRGFVCLALDAPLENAPIEFRIVKAATQLLVALSSMTMSR
jgi:hypothetical protein